MYKYSQVNGADEVIQEHLNKIMNATGKKKFESLVLFGAYGKGEGGFVNGEPVNDYDILLVGGSKTLAKAIGKVELPIKVEVTHFDKLPTICNQQMYEIKYGSTHLLGKRLELPEWEPYDISYADAILSLDKRVLSMLVGKYEMMKEEPDYRKVSTQVGKMIIALGDAILIKRGHFSPSYRTRALMLNQDAIRDLYYFAVEFKLLGTPELNPDQVWALWNEARATFRNYIIENQVTTDYGEMLINFDERIEPDTFKSLLEALGAGDWL